MKYYQQSDGYVPSREDSTPGKQRFDLGTNLVHIEVGVHHKNDDNSADHKYDIKYTVPLGLGIDSRLITRRR